jgi:hypothetical protein
LKYRRRAAKSSRKFFYADIERRKFVYVLKYRRRAAKSKCKFRTDSKYNAR